MSSAYEGHVSSATSEVPIQLLASNLFWSMKYMQFLIFIPLIRKLQLLGSITLNFIVFLRIAIVVYCIEIFPWTKSIVKINFCTSLLHEQVNRGTCGIFSFDSQGKKKKKKKKPNRCCQHVSPNSVKCPLFEWRRHLSPNSVKCPCLSSFIHFCILFCFSLSFCAYTLNFLTLTRTSYVIGSELILNTKCTLNIFLSPSGKVTCFIVDLTTWYVLLHVTIARKLIYLFNCW